MHGNLTQTQRLNTLKQFSTEGEGFNIMLATDLAARGLDFPLVDLVINFDLVSDASKYVHRIGRTARAGNEGQCISLFDDEELETFKKMGKKIVKGKRSKLKIEYLKIDFEEVKGKQFLLSKMMPKVKAALKEERLEKELEKARMEAKKAQNMMDFEEEIKARPKREWIVSSKQKEQLRKMTKKIKTK